MPKTSALVLLVLLSSTACTQVEPSEQAQAQLQALQAATEELQAARTAFESDSAATRDSLDKVRHELQASTAKLAAITALLDDRARSPEPDLPSVPEGSRWPTVEDQADVAAAILCASETRCTVDRGFVVSITANPAILPRQARIVPSFRDGETQGFKLYGIRPGSIPKALGLKNGDLIVSVNGNPLGSLEQAMAVYTKLRTETTFALALERKGAPLALTIEIVDGPETSGSSAP